ncbi:MAG: DUF2956 domain-containing protein [Cognaticolwellia sp.]
MTTPVSNEVQSEALRLAKSTQKKALSKEQTKLIAQGIEKGISEYKKQQKVKARERDKLRKKTVAAKAKAAELSTEVNTVEKSASRSLWLTVLPWLLLVVSWAYFLII